MLAEGAAIVMLATAYAPGCGATGLTKSQTTPVAHMTVAADPKILPLGSRIIIRGLPGVWHVHDTGKDIKGHRLDLFLDGCHEARNWGRRRVHVWVVHVGGHKVYKGGKR
jgi:3D (Asp-Asp-Asp) domain-containing protein